MALNVIEIEDLSKSYIITHKALERRPALKDVALEKLTGMFKPKVSAKNNKEEFWALKNVSFNIEQGSRFAIIGKNGAGKSTLLKIISRITEPTTGSLAITGKVASLLEVGTGFHGELTGRENIYLNGSILGMSKAYIRKTFDEIVSFSEVEHFLDTPVKRYSSGMYMRLAFAVAAHLDPDILIVDEVLAVGDAQFQKKCLAKMNDISKKDGRTVLFVSHNIDSMRTFCNNGIYLEAGKIAMEGDIETLATTYAATFHKRDKFEPKTHQAIYFNRLEVAEQDIHFNENLELHCQIYSDQKKDSFILGLSITDQFDQIAGSTQFYSEKPLHKGMNDVVLSIPIKSIVPGRYKVVLAISLDLSLNNLDVVWYYPAFNVLPDTENKHLFSQWNLSWSSNVMSGAKLIN